MIRPSSKRTPYCPTDPSSNVRFELCITEITPFTVSLSLNAVSDLSLSDQTPRQDPTPSNTSAPSLTQGDHTKGSEAWSETVDLSTVKIGSVGGTSSSSSSSVSRQSKEILATSTTPTIISTSDIMIHVNYIPWQQVQYHFPDEQSFRVYGLTPSTDYEIVMRVHQFSSNVTRVGTRAAPGKRETDHDQEHIPQQVISAECLLILTQCVLQPKTTTMKAGMSAPIDLTGKANTSNESTPTMVPATAPATPVTTKNQKTRKSKKNQKGQKDLSDKGDPSKPVMSAVSSSPTLPATTVETILPTGSGSGSEAGPISTSTSAENAPRPSTVISEDVQRAREQENSNQAILEQLQTSIRDSVEAANTTKATLKKLKRDQGKNEAQLRQELEGNKRNQAKAMVQDQKRRQKLSFLQESIKQADAHTSALGEELIKLREATQFIRPRLENVVEDIKVLEQRTQSTLTSTKTELAPLKAECQRLQGEIKRLEGERAEWTSRTSRLREGEVAPLQLRLQRLEQQQVVWKVAAEASRAKEQEASLKAAVLEEDAHKKTLKTQELEEAIQELKGRNTLLQESVGQEKEVWERLERESDAEVGSGSAFAPQPSMYTSQQYTSPLLPRQQDVSSDGSIRDSYPWLPAGNGIGSNSASSWLSPGNSSTSGNHAGLQMTGQRNSLNSLTTDSWSLWEEPYTASLSKSKTTRTATGNAPGLDRGLRD